MELKCNGEDVEWYEVASDIYPTTQMGLISLPGSGDQRHILEVYNDSPWPFVWKWLTMYSV